MPMQITLQKTPRGKDYVRFLSSGDVTAEDAEGMSKLIAPGTPMSNKAILAVVEPGAKFSPEARQAFTKSGGAEGAANPVAIVVTSAPVRVMLSFIIRMSGAAANTRFFANEPDALTYIEEKLAGS